MPPRGRGKAPVGRGRGGSSAPRPPRGEGGSGGGDDASNAAADTQPGGMPRPRDAQSVKEIRVTTNHFVVTIPKSIIHHYDGRCLKLDHY